MDGQRRTTDLMLDTNQEIERAYITMSHKDFKVIFATDEYGTDTGDPLSISVTVNIRNYGRTPGDVLGGFFGFSIRPESKGPGTRSMPGHDCLDSSCCHIPRELLISVWKTSSKDDRETLRKLWTGEGESLLWFVGQLDYVDRFGKKHSAGYGRRFDSRGRNLVFDHTTQHQLRPPNDRQPEKTLRWRDEIIGAHLALIPLHQVVVIGEVTFSCLPRDPPVSGSCEKEWAAVRESSAGLSGLPPEAGDGCGSPVCVGTSPPATR